MRPFSNISDIESATVYDIGQGSCNSLNASDGSPILYYDLGGGVLNNSKTFPSDIFNGFCFTKNPPIILSHWDWDHWSSGPKFHESLDSKWIVPRQSLGFVHMSFAQDLIIRGNLLIWPQHILKLKTPELTIEKCLGSGRNHSGLALIANSPLAKDETMLFPGDAKYTVIPSGLARTHVSVVVPHHGGRMTNSQVPLPNLMPYSRCVYSFGEANSYGHPHSETKANHLTSGWGNSIVMQTNALRASQLGHIGLFWANQNQVPQIPCSNNQCSLQVNQI